MMPSLAPLPSNFSRLSGQVERMRDRAFMLIAHYYIKIQVRGNRRAHEEYESMYGQYFKMIK